MQKYYAEDFTTPKEMLQMALAYDGVIKYKTRYKGYIVYLPFTNIQRTLGFPKYYLVKKHEFCITRGFEEYEKVYDFLEAYGNEIEEKYEVGVNIFIDKD